MKKSVSWRGHNYRTNEETKGQWLALRICRRRIYDLCHLFVWIKKGNKTDRLNRTRSTDRNRIKKI